MFTSILSSVTSFFSTEAFSSMWKSLRSFLGLDDAPAEETTTTADPVVDAPVAEEPAADETGPSEEEPGMLVRVWAAIVAFFSNLFADKEEVADDTVVVTEEPVADEVVTA